MLLLIDSFFEVLTERLCYRLERSLGVGSVALSRFFLMLSASCLLSLVFWIDSEKRIPGILKPLLAFAIAVACIVLPPKLMRAAFSTERATARAVKRGVRRGIDNSVRKLRALGMLAGINLAVWGSMLSDHSLRSALYIFAVSVLSFMAYRYCSDCTPLPLEGFEQDIGTEEV